MNKVLLVLYFFSIFSWAHPVSYTIDLDVSYDNKKKEAKIVCTSNSKNKCGLYNYKLLDKNDNFLKTKRYPFLKKSSKIKSLKKPSKVIFFLRKTPDHSYIKIFE